MDTPASPGTQDVAQDEPTAHDDSADERYLVRNRLQIRQLLRRLVEQRSLIDAHIGGRDHSFPTAVLEIDEDRHQLLLDGSSQEATNRAAVQAGYLLCFAQLDKVLVRFRIEGLHREDTGRHATFRAAFPEAVLHLQRRELYRLETPIADAPQLHLPAVDGRSEPLALRVVDISGGGLAVAVPAGCPAFSLQRRYEAELVLPGGLRLRIGVVVCNQRPRILPNGLETSRVGLRFEHLPRGGDSAIQRYIFRIDRQRSARRNSEL